MGFSDASVYAKVALPWIIAGFIFHIVGFPTNSWVDANGGSIGIFRECGDLLGCHDVDHGGAPSWHRVNYAFQVIGFIFLIAAMIIVICYVVAMNNNKVVRLLGVITLSVSILFIFIGFVVFAGRFGERWSDVLFDLGWSFALVVVAFICLFIGLVCLFLDIFLPQRESGSHRFVVNPQA